MGRHLRSFDPECNLAAARARIATARRTGSVGTATASNLLLFGLGQFIAVYISDVHLLDFQLFVFRHLPSNCLVIGWSLGVILS